MFIAVGPPSFTALAIIGMANSYPEGYDLFGSDSIAIQVMRVMALLTAIFIWSLSFWFLCISIASVVAVYEQLTFHLNWWAFIFPNVGFTISVISIGKQLRSQGVLWVGSILTVLLVCLYLFVLFRHVRAVIRKEILWQGKDENIYVREKTNKGERRPGSKSSDKCEKPE